MIRQIAEIILTILGTIAWIWSMVEFFQGNYQKAIYLIIVTLWLLAEEVYINSKRKETDSRLFIRRSKDD